WIVDQGVERRGDPDLNKVGDRGGAARFLAAPALYRRRALIDVGGYDPRLNSEEDFELGLRFGRAGIPLRIERGLAARHWSGPPPSFAELSRRWRAGLCFGMGQVLRLYLGRPGFFRLVARQRLYFATLAMWALGLLALLADRWSGSGRWALAWLALPLGVLAV